MATPDEIRASMESYIKYMCESDIDGIMSLYADDAVVEFVGPAIQIVKLAGDAPDGQVEELLGAPPQNVLYTYTVTNAGDTHLNGLAVVDDRGTSSTADDVNFVGVSQGLPNEVVVAALNVNLAPNASLTFSATLAATLGVTTNIATVTGNPTDAGGDDEADHNVTTAGAVTADVGVLVPTATATITFQVTIN